MIVPPSVHPDTGREYAWSVDGHIDEVAVAEVPGWLREQFRRNEHGAAAVAGEWRALVAGTVPEGQRNNAVARLAGHLLRRWVDPHVTLELLLVWNAARCAPPLPAEEVVRTVNSIARRELARRRAAP